jgi:large subunit ribosomal protein L4
MENNMKVAFFSKTGESKAEKELNPDIFGVIPNISLLNQYVHVFRSNQRQGTSKVKTRSEVSGGGKKPWQQKGTGRARQGSTRSPIWRHGGVVHGPFPKSWTLSFPQKMRSLALKSALSLKVSKNSLKVFDAPSIKKPSIKFMQDLLKKMNVHGRVLFIQKENDLVIRKSLSNLKNVKRSLVENLCTYDVLLAKQVILTEDSVNYIEEKYANK